MSGRYLLDTNVAIRVLNQKVDLQARRGSGLEVFLSLTAVGELTARHYGAIKAALQRKGRPIPENDLWIAACARRHGLILATCDGHFDSVEGLQIEAW